jgi:hypothetical protein
MAAAGADHCKGINQELMSAHGEMSNGKNGDGGGSAPFL